MKLNKILWNQTLSKNIKKFINEKKCSTQTIWTFMLKAPNFKSSVSTDFTSIENY